MAQDGRHHGNAVIIEGRDGCCPRLASRDVQGICFQPHVNAQLLQCGADGGGAVTLLVT